MSNPILAAEIENPGALAGAAGVIGIGQTVCTRDYIERHQVATELRSDNCDAAQEVIGSEGARVTLCSEDIEVRMELARDLSEAIAAAHPDDACQLMTGALINLSAGIPSGDVFVSAAEDARWWASIATPAELTAVMAATLSALGNTALHVTARKQLFVRLWNSFSSEDRRAFLDRFARDAT